MKTVVLLLVVLLMALPVVSAQTPPAGLQCSVVQGVLPAGLTLDAATCRISGKPTAPAGVYSFTLRATATGVLPSSKQYEITILPDQQVVFDTASPLPAVISGFSYDVVLGTSVKQLIEGEQAILRQILGDPLYCGVMPCGGWRWR